MKKISVVGLMSLLTVCSLLLVGCGPKEDAKVEDTPQVLKERSEKAGDGGAMTSGGK